MVKLALIFKNLYNKIPQTIPPKLHFNQKSNTQDLESKE